MLKEKDLDIVLIGTPDHWHALPMIAAVEAGADVWVQKPISVDVVEGQAMVAAARKHKRVVQVGTQRRSTPHLIEARDRVVKEGKLGKVALVEIYCYYHMRTTREPAGHRAAGQSRLRNVDRAGADAAVQQAGPSARLAGVHGVRQRHHRRHVHPHARHGALDARPGLAASASSSTGGILVDKNSKANISDTQTATFDFGDLQVVWQHRTWGEADDPEYPWGATLYGDKGTLKVDVHQYDFTPFGQDKPTQTGKALLEYDKYPEDKDGEGPGEARRLGDSRPHAGLPASDRHARQAGGRHRGGPYLDGQLHPGESVDEAGPLAGLGCGQAAGDRRRGGEQAAAPAVPQAVGASGGVRVFKEPRTQ